MAIEKPAPWTGASGTQYMFFVFGLEPDVPRRPGVFIYAKRNAEGAWVPVYMGHGDLAACCTDPGVRRCIAEKSATHLHLRLNSLEADRDTELQDLLAHYANAFAPEGCHRLDGQALSKPAGRAKATKPASKKAATKKAATKKAATQKSVPKKPAVKTKPKSPRPRGR